GLLIECRIVGHPKHCGRWIFREAPTPIKQRLDYSRSYDRLASTGRSAQRYRPVVFGVGGVATGSSAKSFKHLVVGNALIVLEDVSHARLWVLISKECR